LKVDGSVDAIQITEHDGGVDFPVKVVPGSSRNKIAGVWDDALRVTVAAPPEAGKANKEVVRLLAATFGVKRSDVTITHGQTQPLKRVRVVSISAEHARRVLASILDHIG
jgi:uncharacterized protein (TIGR00251 family)